MPNREVIDLSYGSGNPAGTGIPFIPGPRKEPYTEDVIDAGATLATLGQILVEDFTTYGSASWKKSAVANQAVPEFSCGVVVKPAAVNAGANTYPPNSVTPNQTQATVVVNGPALALVTSTANTNKAINIGDPLCLDGAGNLTSAPATPAVGTVVAIAQQGLAGGTGAPTQLKVRMGGY